MKFLVSGLGCALGLMLHANVASAIDWPGRARDLMVEFPSAAPGRRVSILRELGLASGSARNELFLKALEDPELRVRLEAASWVSRLHIQGAELLLLRWLDGNNSAVRAAGARTLGELRSQQALSGIARLLGDQEADVRLAAVTALQLLGTPDVIVPLLNRLADPDADVRVATIRALGALGDTRAVLSILGVVGDGLPEVRIAAASALGNLRDGSASRALVSLLRDPTPEVRIAAIRALGDLGSPDAIVDLATIVLEDHPEAGGTGHTTAVRTALEAVGHIGGPDAARVLAQFVRQYGSDNVTGIELRNEFLGLALRALRAIGDEARDPVAELLAPGLSARRANTDQILELLGSLGGPRLTELLLALSQQDRPSPAALAALGRTGDARALPVLLRRVELEARTLAHHGSNNAGNPPRTQNGNVLLAALRGCTAWASAREALDSAALDPLLTVFPALSSLVSAEKAQAEGLVLTLLGLSGNLRAAPLLLTYLQSGDERLASLAAKALSRTGIDGIEAELPRFLSDARPAIRSQVAAILVQHGQRIALEALESLWSSDANLDHGLAARAMARIARRLHEPRPIAMLLARYQMSSRPLAADMLDALGDLASLSADAKTLLHTELTSRRLGPTAAEALQNAWRPASNEALPPVPELLPWCIETGLAPTSRATLLWGLGRTPEDQREKALDTLRGALQSSDAIELTNSLGALSYLAHKTDAEALQPTLCGLLATRAELGVQTNVLLALAQTESRCSLEAERGMLFEPHHAIVRRAAAEALSVFLNGDAGQQAQARAALNRCSTSDRDGSVASRCRALGHGSPSLRTRDRYEAIDAQLEDGSNGQTLGETEYLLVNVEGVARWGITSPTGWLHERYAPAGSYRVLSPRVD